MKRIKVFADFDFLPAPQEIGTHGAYRLDGAWSQYCVIIPEKHAVVACLSHSPNGARMIQSVWANVYDNL